MDYLNFDISVNIDCLRLTRKKYLRSRERLAFDAIMRMFPNYREIFVEDRYNRIFCINDTFTMGVTGSDLRPHGPAVLINIIEPWDDAFVIPRNYLEPFHVWARVSSGPMAVPPVPSLS